MQSKPLIDPCDFETLIGPISKKAFFEGYWEKKALILNNRGFEGYHDVLRLADIDQLLSTMNEASPHWVRFFQNKKEERLENYKNNDGTINKTNVMNCYKNGGTIILNRLHRRLESVRKLCFGLEEVFGHSVGANSYLTPPGSQGFDAHFDDHDVFILQLEGEKLWRIYDIYKRYPLVSLTKAVLPDLKEPNEVLLRAGDLLYLPRGCVHEALTSEKYSLHLTVGIHVKTYADLLYEMAKNQENLRRALPPRVLIEGNLQEVEPITMGSSEVEKALKGLKKKFAEGRQESFQNDLTTFHWIEEVSSHTLLKKKEHLICHLESDSEKAILHFGKSMIKAPSHASSLIDFILKTPHFSVKTMPDDFDEESRFALVRSLIKNGLLVRV